jgi:ABC-type multidrug transport system ATPase subunit
MKEMMNEALITVRNLTRRFGPLTAVDDLSFDVHAGEAVALWGANGAGKTTALRCLLHLMPFSGTVTIDGLDVQKEGKAARRLVGFVPQELSFHDDLSVVETLTFYARLKKVAHGSDFSPLLERLDLLPHVDKSVGTLSGGLKQRLALALALLGNPPILVLDEPTSNLDIRARDDFIRFLHDLRHEDKTLVFSSHRLEEVRAVADRVLLLESGRLSLSATPHTLTRELGQLATLHIAIPGPTIDPALELLTAHGIDARRNGHGLRVQMPYGTKAEALCLLHDAGIDIHDFTVE